MDLDRHDFELDELVERIKANDNRLVALQVPEGLKMQALEMMDSIEDESGARVILAAGIVSDVAEDNGGPQIVVE